MKKKILVAIFVTAIMLMLPFNAIADDSTDRANEVNKEESSIDINPEVFDPSMLSAEEVNNILTTAIQELFPYYADDPTFQQLQSMIQEQPLDWEEDLFCLIIMFMIIGAAALFLGVARAFIKDIRDRDGVIAFINAIKSGTFGLIAMILAAIFDDECINAPTSPPGSTVISNDCGCMQTYNIEELLIQGTYQV